MPAERDELRPDGLEHPLPRRLDPARALHRLALAAHSEAVALRQPMYRDPTSGLMVFTARFLADRGYCCHSGCRHCPYEST